MTRCRAGDLAVVVNVPHKELKPAIDTIVKLTVRSDSDGCKAWAYEGMPLRGVGPNYTWSWYEIPDDCLQPITPPDGTVTDEEVRELYAPKVPETA